MLELTSTRPQSVAPDASVDFSDVYGQAQAKRSAEVAVAGGHNLMLLGPPGSGKSVTVGQESQDDPANVDQVKDDGELR